MISIPTAYNNVYLSSDTHFSHKNLIRGTSKWKDPNKVRDFNTVEEHDECLLDQLNVVVKKNDYLIHHGDFVFGGKAKLELILSRIHCNNIYWLLGNHDGVNLNYTHPKIKGIFDYQLFQIGQHKLVAMHYPIESFFNKKRGYIHTHGHWHSTNAITAYNRIDVGVEANEFRPYHIDTVIQLADVSRVIKPMYEKHYEL